MAFFPYLSLFICLDITEPIFFIYDEWNVYLKNISSDYAYLIGLFLRGKNNISAIQLFNLQLFSIIVESCWPIKVNSWYKKFALFYYIKFKPLAFQKFHMCTMCTEPCHILAAVDAIWNWQQPEEEKLLTSKQKGRL